MMVQKDADPSKRDTVVLLLQDMLEVTTRDMMQNENRLVDCISIVILLESLFSVYVNIYYPDKQE